MGATRRVCEANTAFERLLLRAPPRSRVIGCVRVQRVFKEHRSFTHTHPTSQTPPSQHYQHRARIMRQRCTTFLCLLVSHFNPAHSQPQPADCDNIPKEVCLKEQHVKTRCPLLCGSAHYTSANDFGSDVGGAEDLPPAKRGHLVFTCQQCFQV